MNVNNISNYLKQNALWCLWGEGKIPYNPRTGSKAQSNNPYTFSDFDTAYKTYQTGIYDGLGVGIFNGIGAIDIDNCIKSGIVSELATEIVERVGSYTEISPSGKGIRVIFTLKKVPTYNKSLYYIANRKSGLEIYISGTTNRYVTITGDVINDNPVIDITPKLIEILDAFMLKPYIQNQTVKADVQAVTPAFSSGHYLKIGLEKDEKLKNYWNGARPHASESENDAGFMAKLLYWCNNDSGMAISTFLSSPYVGQKDYAHTKKLCRFDYLPRLTELAKFNRTAAEDDEEWRKKKRNVQ